MINQRKTIAKINKTCDFFKWPGDYGTLNAFSNGFITLNYCKENWTIVWRWHQQICGELERIGVITIKRDIQGDLTLFNNEI